jgi:hypothetical protein
MKVSVPMDSGGTKTSKFAIIQETTALGLPLQIQVRQQCLPPTLPPQLRQLVPIPDAQTATHHIGLIQPLVTSTLNATREILTKWRVLQVYISPRVKRNVSILGSLNVVRQMQDVHEINQIKAILTVKLNYIFNHEQCNK